MEMPATFKALGFDEPLIDAAARYWGDRIRIARMQRNALLYMLGFGLLSYNIASLSAVIQDGQDGHLLVVALKWIISIAFGGSVLFLGYLEFAIHQRNQALRDGQPKMNDEQRVTVVTAGNSVAVGVLMFRKPPSQGGWGW